MAPALENGALRGTQVRCPGCTLFNPPGIRCPRCACGPVPAGYYGAARMLLRAGVDRFALVGRLETLEPSLAAQLELQYATQWREARRIVRDVRRCEPFLSLSGFAEESEDRWAEVLPWANPAVVPIPALGQGDGTDDEPLEQLHRRSQVPEVRHLAALAEVNQGNLSRDLLASVTGALDVQGLIGLEAALTLTRWRVWNRTRLGNAQRDILIRNARLAFEHFPEQRARAAVAWVRITGEPPEVDLLFALREGLRSPDGDLRFECALCLQDEAGLLEAATSPEADKASLARQTLAPLESSRLLARMVESGEVDFARDVMRQLRSPPSLEALDAVLAVAAKVGAALVDPVVSWAQRTPFERLAPPVHARWRTFARETLGTWPALSVLRLWEWAHASREEDARLDEEVSSAFQGATVRALSTAPSAERERLVGESAFRRFLLRGDVAELALVHSWARDAACAERLLDLLISMPGWRDETGQGHARCARLLMAAWERPSREAVLAPLAKAVRSWSGISGREVFLEALWSRFLRYPEERADVLSTFEPWRTFFWERQLASEPDALVTFETWWRVDSQLGLPKLVEWFVGEVPPEELRRRLPAVWAAAEARVDAWPRSTSHAVFLAAASLCGWLRQGHVLVVPDVERFLAWVPDFERRVREAPVHADESSYHNDLLADLHVEVRMMSEWLERFREAEEVERQAALMRRVEASRLKDHELQLQALQQGAGGIDPAPPRRVGGGRALWVMPELQLVPLDSEVVLPGVALETLMDFARVLQALRTQSDALEVFSAHGLSVEEWSAQAKDWGQVMTQRRDLCLRFAELLEATWSGPL
ncbi:hypothetical protein MYSTI_00847 [Myxococcus stipitatus DSM 14675]|uniref:Uncharacterized protein n=1 Tax=Myxococcus stipitatus (strain DSM 14675 / JCM 12634 / Mx s8) TaxID=1278073 RepID=L7U083_MYXSD|nr:hypothetical protein [Myxococcus stipitatus]AGC42196.1 hypothetical protein MYSTI_00847 [Myxococcus stipitatus DSM 14675]